MGYMNIIKHDIIIDRRNMEMEINEKCWFNIHNETFVCGGGGPYQFNNKQGKLNLSIWKLNNNRIMEILIMMKQRDHSIRKKMR